MEIYLIIAVLFISGGSFGIASSFSLIAHPSLLEIDPKSAVQAFIPLFKKTHKSMISLSIILSIVGLMISLLSSNWWWFTVTLAVHLNAPFTLIFMMPVNNKLMNANPKTDFVQINNDLKKWGKLHLVRTIWNGCIFVVLLFLAIH